MLAIERERGSVEAIYCGRSLLCRPTYWRGSAGSSDVISAAFNVNFTLMPSARASAMKDAATTLLTPSFS